MGMHERVDCALAKRYGMCLSRHGANLALLLELMEQMRSHLRLQRVELSCRLERVHEGRTQVTDVRHLWQGSDGLQSRFPPRLQPASDWVRHYSSATGLRLRLTS